MSPTGTEIGAPVSRTSAPRCMPSVGFSAIARTRLSPMCSATSMVIVPGLTVDGGVDQQRVVDVGHLVDGELDVDHRADHPGHPADAAGGRFGVLFFNRGGHLVPSFISSVW